MSELFSMSPEGCAHGWPCKIHYLLLLCCVSKLSLNQLTGYDFASIKTITRTSTLNRQFSILEGVCSQKSLNIISLIKQENYHKQHQLS